MIKQFKYVICVVVSLLIRMIVIAQVNPPVPYNNNTRVSYVRSWEATAPESNSSTLVTRPLKDVKQLTGYYDGLGRPLQTVIKQGSLETGGASADLISPMVYDELGREVQRYLPFVANTTGGNTSVNDGFFKLNPFQQQAIFAAQQYTGET